MKKILFRVVMFILVLSLVFTTTPVAFAYNNSVKTISLSAQNPLYDGLHIKTTQTKTSQKLYSSQSTPQYTDDTEALVASIRSAMENRKTEFTVYYSTNTMITKADLQTFFDLALEETNVSTQGDYLRWVWSSMDAAASGFETSGIYKFAITYNLSYYTSKEQEDQLTQQINALLASFGFTNEHSDYYKINTIYNYITENVVYDYAHLESEDYFLHYTAYAALINKTAVCQGYSVLFYRLVKECGIDARVISGKSAQTNENHGWNIVKIDDYYYYVDSTWDAGQTIYSYFLKGSSDFTGHISDSQYESVAFLSKYQISSLGYIAEISDPAEADNFRYVVSGGKAFIQKYLGNEANVVVPSYIEHYPVYQINHHAFADNNTIETLTFSEGIYSMESQAVYKCINLKAVHYPSTMIVSSYGYTSLTTVPTDCYNLATITVAEGNPYIKVADGILYTADMKIVLQCPAQCVGDKITVANGVTEIGNEAFANCINVKSVKLPDTVEFIGYWAFCSANNLESIEMPDSLEFIGQFAFMQTALTSIDIPAATTCIKDDAFANCYLKTINVDSKNTVYKMVNGALCDSTKLIKYTIGSNSEYTVPNGITEISGFAFEGAKDLEKIEFSNTVEIIGQSSFSHCESLTHITLPNSVTTIEDFAFDACYKLVSIIIPASVTSIDDNATWAAKGFTVYGEVNSTAQTYANKVEAPFKTLDTFVCTSGHNLQKNYVENTPLLKSYRYVCSVCSDKSSLYFENIKEFYNMEISLEYTTATYTGSEIKPKVTQVKDGDKVLTENVDYTISHYISNTDVGTGFIFIDGIGGYTGTQFETFTISQASISTALVTVDDTPLVTNGLPLEPSVTVEWNLKTLVEDVDYTLTYENNVLAGSAIVKVTGIGNFTGHIIKGFVISEIGHNYGSTWNYNDTQHWKDCVCSEKHFIDNHSYTGTCDKDCDICGAVRTVTHSFTNYVYNNDATTEKDGTETATCVCGQTDTRIKAGTKLESSVEIKDTAAIFGDVKTGSWYKEFVDYAYSYGMFNGTTATTFEPNANMNRAMFVSVLARIAGVTVDNTVATKFSDVPANKWYTGAVKWASDNGIVTGKTETTFAPLDNITREQMCALIVRFATYENITLKADGEAENFTDADKISGYAKEAVTACQKAGLVNGMGDGTFAPKGKATRAQVSKILAYFHKNYIA